MAYVQAGKVRLEYFDVELGDRTMVLVHGASSSARIWHSVQNNLVRAGIRTVAIAMRGAGGSDSTSSPDDYNPETYAKDLAAALKAMNIESLVLFGHSLGVATVLSFMKEFALEFDVRGLVLMAGGASTGRPSPTPEQVAEVEKSVDSPPTEEETFRRARWEPNHIGLPPNVRDELWRNIQNNPRERTIGQRIGERPDMTKVLSTLSIPTLVIGGDADATVPIESTLRGYLSLPVDNRHLHIFHGVGHFPNAQIPEELSRVIHSFVDEQFPDLTAENGPD